MAVLSFLVRLVHPFGSETGFWDLNLWEWPGCFALFVLGIAGSSRGWVDGVPDLLWRRSRVVALGATAGLAVVVGCAEPLGVVEDELWGGLARRLDRRLRWVGPAVRRSAYAAFMVQSLVLVGLAVALRPVAVPAEVKALAVAAGGVAGSFALAWLLLSRMPLLAGCSEGPGRSSRAGGGWSGPVG